MTQPVDYPWSSFRHHALGEPGMNADWLTAHEEYLRLGRNEKDRQSTYQGLFSAALSDNDLAEIRECTHRDGRWAASASGNRSKLWGSGAAKGVGRPKKENNRV